MRKASLLTSAALAALLLTGCSGDIEHGVITGKDYSPASSYISWQPVYNGKTTVLVPVTMLRGECYRFHLKDSQGHTGDVCVPQFEYQKLKVGDNY